MKSSRVDRDLCKRSLILEVAYSFTSPMAIRMYAVSGVWS